MRRCLDRASLLVWVLVEVCISLVRGRHLSSIHRPRSALAGAEVGCAKMEAAASGVDRWANRNECAKVGVLPSAGS